MITHILYFGNYVTFVIKFLFILIKIHTKIVLMIIVVKLILRQIFFSVNISIKKAEILNN